MEYIIFGAKILIVLLLCFILLRSLQYFILQVGFYYKSRHLAAFLDKKKVFQKCAISAWRRFQGVHP